MKFFAGITSKEVLRTTYKGLCKIHHPDVGGDEEVMKAINAEYDICYEALATGNNVFISWENLAKAREQAAREAEKSREYIVFMVRNKYGKGFVGFKYVQDFFFVRKQLLIPEGELANKARSGFARVKISYTEGENHVKVTGEMLNLTCPNVSQMAYFLERSQLSSYASKVKYFENGADSFYCVDNSVYAVVDGEPMQFSADSSFNMQSKAVYEQMDFTFMAFQDCSKEEFLKYHDVNYRSQFHDSLQMKAMDSCSIYVSGLISYLIRKGAVTIFQSRFDGTMKYGTFNLVKLVELLPKTSIEDVEEIQDYLDTLNSAFDDKVKAKIKKGKLQIKI